MILEKLVQALRSSSAHTTEYEKLLGGPAMVQSYANTGVSCADQFSTAIAVIVHKYSMQPGKTSDEHAAYREALADFVEFFDGCVKESVAKNAKANPKESKKSKKS